MKERRMKGKGGGGRKVEKSMKGEKERKKNEKMKK